MKLFMQTLLFHCCTLWLLPASAISSLENCASPLFPTELAAVRAAADRFNPLSIREDREYVGAIYESGGEYGYTVSTSSGRRDSWQLSIPRVDWGSVRAIWHTHGDASPQHRYFSDADTKSVKKFGLPFYLADYTGYLKVFNSGDKTLNPITAERLNLPRQSGFAIGEFVRDKLNRPIRVKVREVRSNRRS